MEPALPPKPEGRTYIPHSFTEEELRRFFYECDRIIPLRPELKYRMKKITCPVFFRLLYSSGIRTTEARYLKREDVDLEHGVLNIRKSKGYDQHYVALHESMKELLKQYDKAAESIRPDRTYFFETPNGKYYSRQWVTQTFQCLWEKANGKQNKAVAYDLRHNYAVVNINHWADDTIEFDQKLHYLSKSMGHRSIDSTLYYYSITPCLADILLKKTEKSFNELLPEVGHKQLETTMRYLDITTEDKIKALATLEDENQKAVPKKWKNKNGTLTDFCGLKK